MFKFGNKPAVRTFESSEPLHVRRKTLLNAFGLVRSMHPPTCHDEAHRIFRRTPLLFTLDDIESELLGDLLRTGYGVLPGFFSKELIDRIYSKADAIFRSNDGNAAGLGNLCSEHGSDRPRTDAPGEQGRLIEIVDPLASIPETLDIVFHESILKTAAHFFRHIPRLYRISVMRYFPGRQAIRLDRLYETFAASLSLCVIVELTDIDESRGPLVYIPDRHYVHEASSGECGQSEQTTRESWAVLRGEKGSIIAIPRRSPRSSLWTYPADVNGNARTSIVINIGGYQRGELPVSAQNRMLRWNFDRMTALQQMFAYPGFVHEPAPAFAKVS